MSDVGVFVIGVARSGTSATARLVNVLGLQVPEEEHLKQGEEANPDGFLEVTKLTKINHWIMEGFGGHSMAPPRLPAGWLDEPWIVELGVGARQLFLELYRSAPWVWKHPTTSMTLPFWLRILDTRPVIVVTVRHPLENAASIRAFRGNKTMSAMCSLAIWERYLRSALAYAAGHPTFVVGYRELCDEPQGMVRDLAAFLAANGAISDGSVAEDELTGLVRRDFRHHAVDPDQCRDGDAELSDTQQRLWKLTRELVGPHQHFPSLDLGDETEWIPAILEEQNRYEWMREEFRDSERTLKRELSRGEKRYARALGATQKLEREVAKLHSDKQSLKRELSRVESELSRVESDRSRAGETRKDTGHDREARARGREAARRQADHETQADEESRARGAAGPSRRGARSSARRSRDRRRVEALLTVDACGRPEGGSRPAGYSPRRPLRITWKDCAALALDPRSPRDGRSIRCFGIALGGAARLALLPGTGQDALPGLLIHLPANAHPLIRARKRELRDAGCLRGGPHISRGLRGTRRHLALEPVAGVLQCRLVRLDGRFVQLSKLLHVGRELLAGRLGGVVEQLLRERVQLRIETIGLLDEGSLRVSDLLDVGTLASDAPMLAVRDEAQAEHALK